MTTNTVQRNNNIAKWMSFVSLWLHRETRLLENTSSRFFFVGILALSSTIFLWLYNPVGISSFYLNTWMGSLLTLKAAGLLGSILIAFSQLVLRPLFSIRLDKRIRLAGWILFEIMILSLLYYLIYGERGRDPQMEYLVVLRYTILLVPLPYLFSLLLLEIVNTNHLKKKQRDGLFFSMKDEKGQILFSVKPEDILYARAEDNYISLYFILDQKPQNKLLRISLTDFVSQLSTSGIHRVHRSFAVNRNHLTKIERHNSRKYIYVRHFPEQALPVSGSYEASVNNWLAEL